MTRVVVLEERGIPRPSITTITVRTSYPLRFRLRLGVALFRLAAWVIGASSLVVVECPVTPEECR